MADGEMTLKFDSSTLAGVAEAAASAGVTPEAWTEQLVRDALAENERARWAVSLARLEAYDRGESRTYTVDEVFNELRQRVAAKRASR